MIRAMIANPQGTLMHRRQYSRHTAGGSPLAPGHSMLDR